jgi:hypothetical protein
VQESIEWAGFKKCAQVRTTFGQWLQQSNDSPFMNKCINDWVNRPIDQSMNQPTNQPINQSNRQTNP